MTTRTRRALIRVQHAARRLSQAVDALRPQDLKAMGTLTHLSVGMGTIAAERIANLLTRLLGPDAPTEREKFAASRDPEDALMEARDVAADETQGDLT